MDAVSEKISGSKTLAGTETPRDGATTIVLDGMVVVGKWQDDGNAYLNTLHYVRIQSDSQSTPIVSFNNELIKILTYLLKYDNLQFFDSYLYNFSSVL